MLNRKISKSYFFHFRCNNSKSAVGRKWYPTRYARERPNADLDCFRSREKKLLSLSFNIYILTDFLTYLC